MHPLTFRFREQFITRFPFSEVIIILASLIVIISTTKPALAQPAIGESGQVGITDDNAQVANEASVLPGDIHVLLVDDYKTALRIYRNLFRQLNYENVDEAIDGAGALRRLHADTYDLIFADWTMEPMTGFELLKAVRADSALKDIPFIMVVPESKTDWVIAAKKAGANNYIVKPFNAATLKAKLTAVLGN